MAFRLLGIYIEAMIRSGEAQIMENSWMRWRFFPVTCSPSSLIQGRDGVRGGGRRTEEKSRISLSL